jgi:hypothetical protein
MGVAVNFPLFTTTFSLIPVATGPSDIVASVVSLHSQQEMQENNKAMTLKLPHNYY